MTRSIPHCISQHATNVVGQIILLAAFLVSGRVTAQNTIVQNNFDSEVVGDAPSDWKAGGGGFAMITNGVFVSKPNSLALVNTKLATMAYALKKIDPFIVSNEGEPVTVSLRIRLAQKNAAVNLMVTDAATAFVFRVCFNNGGQITASSGKENLTLAAYESDVWYDVRVECVPMKHEYDVTVKSGNTVVANRKGLTSESREFFYVYLANYGMVDGKAVAYFDDVNVAKGRSKAE